MMFAFDGQQECALFVIFQPWFLQQVLDLQHLVYRECILCLINHLKTNRTKFCREALGVVPTASFGAQCTADYIEVSVL